jgi:hypothetical protein
MESLERSANQLRSYLSHLTGCDWREYLVCTCGLESAERQFDQDLSLAFNRPHPNSQPDGNF